MINKKVDSIEEALKGVSDHMTFMLGGFGLFGIPENAIYFFRSEEHTSELQSR